MKRTDFTFESKFKYDKAKLEKVLKRKVLDSQSTKSLRTPISKEATTTAMLW